jgi:ubiquinol-cytochrome c reductase cytochrome c subunit
MRAVLTLAFAVALLLVPGAADAGTPHGTPKEPLAAYGYHLYGQYCLACHGGNAAGRYDEPSNATGAGPCREQGQQGGIGPSLHGVGALAADFYLRTGYMPLKDPRVQPSRSRVLFDDRQIRALVAYVASLGHGPAIPHPQPQLGSIAAGQKLFTQSCAGCHQIATEGGYVTGARVPPLEDASSRQIAQAVRIGPYVMPKFSSTQISAAQLNDLIAYVQYAKHPDDRGGWSIGHLGPWPEGLVTWLIAIGALVCVCLLFGKRLRS